jgi:opacity protein-like surface antigen
MTFPVSQSPITEVGSNWYLRGDIGLSVDQAPSFSMAAASMPPAGPGILPFSSTLGSSSWRDDVSADIDLGYRLNNWLRFEGAYEYRTGPAGHNINSVICPTTAAPTNTCTSDLYLRQRNSTALASAYVDLGNYWGFTPYLGAGAGLNANMIDGSVAYTDNLTGAPYIGGWSRSVQSNKYSLAWALMAGLGIQISPSATLDVGYRYLNAGTSTVPITPQIGSSVKQPNVSQDFRIGIRYMAD